MKASFGYRDGSGEFYITVDTDKCNGCGDCITACPAHVLELADNEYDPMAEQKMAAISGASRNSLKYDCGPCKPPSGERHLPCVAACKPQALVHSW